MGVSSMQNPVCQRFSEVFRSLCQMWTIKITFCPAFQAAKKALCEVPPVRLQCTGGKNPKCTLAKWMHRCGDIFSRSLRHFEVPLGHTCIFGDDSRQRNEPRTEIVAREGRELIQKKSGTHSKQDIVFNIIIYNHIIYI